MRDEGCVALQNAPSVKANKAIPSVAKQCVIYRPMGPEAITGFEDRRPDADDDAIHRTSTSTSMSALNLMMRFIRIRR